MKSTELRITDVRIGNLIHGVWEEEVEEIDEYVEKLGIVRVIGLDENSSLGDGWSWMVESRHEEEVEMYSGFYGIPLTEEWLIKFGFAKDSRGYALKDKNSLSFGITSDKRFLPCFLEIPIGIATVEHVHQLQNLYFALTNEELIYTP